MLYRITPFGRQAVREGNKVAEIAFGVAEDGIVSEQELFYSGLTGPESKSLIKLLHRLNMIEPIPTKTLMSSVEKGRTVFTNFRDAPVLPVSSLRRY